MASAHRHWLNIGETPEVHGARATKGSRQLAEDPVCDKRRLL
jgi:hypothetical protein